MTTKQFSTFERCPIIPVLVLDQRSVAVPLARALKAGGITHLEVTLRTPVALDAVTDIKKSVPGLQVGVGTVLSPVQYRDSVEAGADFIVAPGATIQLFEEAMKHSATFVPGAATSSEIMSALEFNLKVIKFFPAGISGGVAALKALAGPFPEVGFMPTGGVSQKNIVDYLELDNVIAVGGSWLTPVSAIAMKDWECIESIVRESIQLLEHLSKRTAA
jgi:2-dehydro-3-deoxyphosphogluconate aldolase/(4S)-4-hydroxy-2-oxoglutarate aldolase